MRKQFGTRVMDKQEGMLRAIHFPSMAKMGERTGDGRLLQADGGGVRDLPRTIFAQFESQPGHDGSVPVGRLDAVAFDEDGSNIEGWGWLIDDPNGSTMQTYLATKVLFHNSIDLAEVKVKLDIEEDDDGQLSLVIDFTEWNIAATTFVGKPAFKDASGEFDEEIKAALEGDEPLDVMVGSYEVQVSKAEELMASLATTDDTTVVEWADFHIPEADRFQKIVVDQDLRVYGHLCLWDVPDEGLSGKFFIPPRPTDAYASFNQAGPLTELGQVETGPIFFQGGHPEKPIGGSDPYRAYGGVENAWADVRVTPGVFGPWISGRVRPGVADSVVYAARASRISGHWVGDKLRAIVSCNVARFNVPGSGLAVHNGFGASFSETGEMLELVASFPEWLATDEAEVNEVDQELAEWDAYTEELFEDVNFAVDTVPTTEMAAEAEQGLAWRREFKRGGAGVALARARDIKNRKRLSHSTLKRMQAFFQRHSGDNADPGWAKGQEGYPSAARINWALWGGDSAQGWVSGKLSAIDNEREASAEAEQLLLELDAEALLAELDD
jgi:hypothetical protein